MKPVVPVVKNCRLNRKHKRSKVQLGRKSSRVEKMATHSSILLKISGGLKSLVGFSPSDHKESNKTAQKVPLQTVKLEGGLFSSSNHMI